MTQDASAKATYEARELEARELIEAIQTGLTWLQQKQRLNENSWGHAWDLGHVTEKLKDICDFLEVAPPK